MVEDLGYTRQVLETIPNAKKLGIHYCHSFMWCLGDFAHLQKLETLEFLFESPATSTFRKNITFPLSLKKITMERARFRWEDMTIFGSLPNLEVLKLRDFAFQGREWVPTEGKFPKLTFLVIWETNLEQWRADDAPFS